MPNETGAAGWTVAAGVEWGYWSIAEDIAARIRDGRLPPGARLPSRAQLAVMYRSSLSTVARSMTVLQAWQLIQGRQGQAMYVAGPAAEPGNG